MEQLFIYMLGAAGYGLIEILWRGYTHWTMLITGGLCFFLLFYLFEIFKENSAIEKAIAGSLLITVVELFSGIIINIILGWDVWDYSDVPFNILGQVCLPYSLLWFLISFALIFFCRKLKIFINYLQHKNA